MQINKNTINKYTLHQVLSIFVLFLTERNVKFTTESCIKGKDHDEQQAIRLITQERRDRLPTDFNRGDFIDKD